MAATYAQGIDGGPEILNSEDARIQCRASSKALLGALPDSLAAAQQPSFSLHELKAAVSELRWLQVAKEQVGMMARAHAAASELQRTIRTSSRHENPDGSIGQAVARLLNKASASLQAAAQDEDVWQAMMTPSEAEGNEKSIEDAGYHITQLPGGRFRVHHPALASVASNITHKLDACYIAVAEKWGKSLDNALRECGWPPTPPPTSPDAPPAATAWQGFHAAPEVSVAAMQNAFVALLALQTARGMHGALPGAVGGPWAAPELEAMKYMVAEPVRVLKEAFLSGGTFDRPDATGWIFQAASHALEHLPDAVEGLQATLDASLPDWQYSVGFEAVRSMHAEVCKMLLRSRLPSISGQQWVSLVDECIHWERVVLPRMGCVLPEEATLIAPSQLYGSLMSQVYSEERLRQQWWAAESASAAAAANAIVAGDENVWTAQEDDNQTPGEVWQQNMVMNGAATQMHALLLRLFSRCMWLGATPARMIMVQVVLGAALDEYLIVVNRLLSKCKAYDETMSQHWLPRLCGYACASRALVAISQDLLAAAAFPALTVAEETATATALKALHAAQPSDAAGTKAGVLRGALHAGQSAVASLTGIFAAALPRLSPGMAGEGVCAASTGPQANGMLEPSSPSVAGGEAAALVLKPQQQQLESLARACTNEAARALGASALECLAAVRSQFRAARVLTVDHAVAAAGDARDVIRQGLQRLAAHLDRRSFQLAMRGAGKMLDDAVSGELMQAAQSGSADDALDVIPALCKELAAAFKPYSNNPEALFKQSLSKDARAPFPTA